IGVVSPEFLTRNRRWAIVISFVLGAIITPTLDPINQAFVAGPIIVLYEVGVQLSKVGARMRSRNS
ncbi:MAG: twin-arginine translocase subunit TatC, partial [Chloroflexota bacterium]|nr:twin-arginine translocase subunit TatC [Chloroflexota bacterium]